MLTGIFIVLCSFNSNAGIIEMYDKNGDLSNNLQFLTGAEADNFEYGILQDNRTGLEWLNLNHTARKSMSYVESLMGVGGIYEGWRFAYSAEVSDLVISAGGTPMNCTPHSPVVDVIDADYQFCGRSEENNGVVASFINQLGALHTGWGASILRTGDYYIDANDTKWYSLAHLQDFASSSHPNTDYIHSWSGSSSYTNSSGTYYAVSLVRGNAPPESNSGAYYPARSTGVSVPEPSSILIFSLAIPLLISMRRKSTNYNYKLFNRDFLQFARFRSAF